MTDLIVVVHPEYGDRLERATQLAPVWVVATQTNKHACERLWQSNPHRDHREKGAVTSYNTSEPEDRLGSLLGIYSQLEDHHGEEVTNNVITFRKGFVLEVIGLALADNVTDALRELGFTSFIETPEGFQACK